MLHVITLESSSHNGLSSEVNNWLLENQDTEVIDIKYACWGNKIGVLGPTFSAYSALIMYKNKAKKNKK
jgi:hypothetical protein